MQQSDFRLGYYKKRIVQLTESLKSESDPKAKADLQGELDRYNDAILTLENISPANINNIEEVIND